MTQVTCQLWNTDYQPQEHWGAWVIAPFYVEGNLEARKKFSNLPNDCSEPVRQASNSGGLLNHHFAASARSDLEWGPLSTRSLKHTTGSKTLRTTTVWWGQRWLLPSIIHSPPSSSAGEHCELELSRRQSKSLKLSSVPPEGGGNDWSSNSNLDCEVTQDQSHMQSKNEKGPVSLNAFGSPHTREDRPVSGFLNETRCCCFRFSINAADPLPLLGRQRAAVRFYMLVFGAYMLHSQSSAHTSLGLETCLQPDTQLHSEFLSHEHPSQTRLELGDPYTSLIGMNSLTQLCSLVAPDFFS